MSLGCGQRQGEGEPGELSGPASLAKEDGWALPQGGFRFLSRGVRRRCGVQKTSGPVWLQYGGEREPEDEARDQQGLEESPLSSRDMRKGAGLKSKEHLSGGAESLSTD